MKPHLHVSALDFLVFCMFAIIFGFLWNRAATALADRPLGKAMSQVWG